jgi:hypothetical protein
MAQIPKYKCTNKDGVECLADETQIESEGLTRISDAPVPAPPPVEEAPDTFGDESGVHGDVSGDV